MNECVRMHIHPHTHTHTHTHTHRERIEEERRNRLSREIDAEMSTHVNTTFRFPVFKSPEADASGCIVMSESVLTQCVNLRVQFPLKFAVSTNEQGVVEAVEEMQTVLSDVKEEEKPGMDVDEDAMSTDGDENTTHTDTNTHTDNKHATGEAITLDGVAVFSVREFTAAPGMVFVPSSLFDQLHVQVCIVRCVYCICVYAYLLM
jgi:hypothetical protein